MSVGRLFEQAFHQACLRLVGIVSTRASWQSVIGPKLAAVSLTQMWCSRWSEDAPASPPDFAKLWQTVGFKASFSWCNHHCVAALFAAEICHIVLSGPAAQLDNMKRRNVCLRIGTCQGGRGPRAFFRHNRAQGDRTSSGDVVAAPPLGPRLAPPSLRDAHAQHYQECRGRR